MAYCFNCGRELDENCAFCPECGAKVAGSHENYYVDSINGAMKRCSVCGETMPADSFYCLNCGTAFIDEQDDFQQVLAQVKYSYGTWKNKWIAFTLCLLLGWMGAHKYYEERPVVGILYTITCGGFGIGWIIDCFILLFKPNPYLVKR